MATSIHVLKDAHHSFIGVCLSKGAYRARITIQGESRDIGTYKTIEEAARAHDRYMRSQNLRTSDETSIAELPFSMALSSW